MSQASASCKSLSLPPPPLIHSPLRNTSSSTNNLSLEESLKESAPLLLTPTKSYSPPPPNARKASGSNAAPANSTRPLPSPSALPQSGFVAVVNPHPPPVAHCTTITPSLSPIMIENQPSEQQQQQQVLAKLRNENARLQYELNYMRKKLKRYKYAATTGAAAVHGRPSTRVNGKRKKPSPPVTPIVLTPPPLVSKRRLSRDDENTENDAAVRNSAVVDLEKHESLAGLHHRKSSASASSPFLSNHFYVCTTPPAVTASATNLHRKSTGDLEVGLNDVGSGISSSSSSASSFSDLNSALHSSDPAIRASHGMVDNGSLTFRLAVQDRAGWLVGLLVLQSLSSFIISHNEQLLQRHIIIVQFLTMLVGAGGNAGNQASVRVIRGLATGSVHDGNLRSFFMNELVMAVTLSAILGVAGCLRAAVFGVPLLETLAITTSLCAIVFISIVLGVLLPLGLRSLKVDPAHASTSIQVIMDILGVTITVGFSSLILSKAFHSWIMASIP